LDAGTDCNGMKPYLLRLAARISLETWHGFENLLDAINQARHDLAGLPSKLNATKEAASLVDGLP